MVTKSLLLPRAIREARKNCGLTQAEMAEQLGVSQATISFWENGAETPALDNQVKLVKLMPDIFNLLAEQETNLLTRLYQLERAAYGESCSCERKGIAAPQRSTTGTPVPPSPADDKEEPK